MKIPRTSKFLAGILCLFVSLAIKPAHATTNDAWTGPSGAWETTPGSWSTGLPTSASNVEFSGTNATYTVTLNTSGDVAQAMTGEYGNRVTLDMQGYNLALTTYGGSIATNYGNLYNTYATSLTFDGGTAGTTGGSQITGATGVIDDGLDGSNSKIIFQNGVSLTETPTSLTGIEAGAYLQPAGAYPENSDAITIQSGSVISTGFAAVGTGLSADSNSYNSITVTGTGSSLTLVANVGSGATGVMTIGLLNGTGTNNAVTIASGATLSAVSLVVNAESGGNQFTTSAGGTSTISGVTSNYGTIAVNGTGILNANGGLTNQNGGTLTGTGTINGAVTSASGSIIAPGPVGSAGTLTLGGALSIGTGATLDIDLATATTLGSGVNDLITMTGAGASGALTLGSSTTVNFNALGTLTVGTAYTLINGATSITGFNPANFTTTGDGSLVATYSDSSSALFVTFSNVVSTPSIAYFNGITSSDLNTSSNFYTAATGTTAVSGPVGSTTDVFITNNAGGANSNAPTLNTGALAINSLTFTGTGTAAATQVNLSGSNTLTINAAAGTYSAGTGVTVLSGAANDTISAPVALGASQTWSVTDSTNTLTDSGGISGATFALTKAGAGTLALTHSTGNTYTGGTTVNAGTLLVGNSSGSATGSGALSVLRGAALAGTGTSSGSSFAIGGTSGSGTASVYVGQTAATGDTNTTNKLTLLGSGASTIANANLTFNLDTTSPGGSPGLGNELLVGGTAITFGSGTAGSNPVTLTLNLQGGQNITNVPYFVLIAGTVGTPFTSQYSGLSLGTSFSADGGTLTPILNSNVGGSGNLILALNLNGSTFYAGQEGLYLYQTSGGVDDIVVIPEPGTWALMLGGLAVLAFWQRRKISLN